jgi:hypothetical protein
VHHRYCGRELVGVELKGKVRSHNDEGPPERAFVVLGWRGG